MVSLKWGDALSILLPGALGLFAVAGQVPGLAALIAEPASIGVPLGVALLIAAALFGGLLEGLTRVTWEKYVLTKLCPNVSVLSRLTKDNLELYERGVQSSYKYVTFYANFGFAVLFLLLARFNELSWSWRLFCLAAMLLLFTASYVQWTYYVNYNRKVFGEEQAHVAQRPAAGQGSPLPSPVPDADVPDSQRGTIGGVGPTP